MRKAALKDQQRQAWLVGLYVGQAFAGQLKPLPEDSPKDTSPRGQLEALAAHLGKQLRLFDPQTKVIQGIRH